MRWLAPFSLAPILAVACGSEAQPIEPPAHPASVGNTYTVNDVCDHIATSVCAAREPCCRSLDLAFDPVRCEARQRDSCGATIDAVNQGLVEFDGTYVDACVEELVRLTERCTVTAADIVYASFDLSAICGLAFQGTKAAGEACQIDAECAHATDTVAACDDDALICVQSRVHDQGGVCDLTGNFCGPGLYCAYDLSQMPYVGTCEPVQGLGSTCDPGDVVSPCGPGRYCDVATSSCLPAQAFGSPCARDVECASLSCTAEGTCALETPVVDVDECTG